MMCLVSQMNLQLSVPTNLRTGFHKPPTSREINSLTIHSSTIASSLVSRTCEARLKPHHSFNPSLKSVIAHFGKVRALGIVFSVDRERASARILWREVDVTLRPSSNGRRYWEQAKHWFAFAPDVVSRYGLRDLHAEYFPDITGFDIPSPPPPVGSVAGHPIRQEVGTSTSFGLS